MALQDHNIEKSDDTEASVGSNRHASEPITPIIPPEGGLTDLLPTSRTQSIYAIYHFLDIRATAMSDVAPGSVVWPSLRYLWSYSGIDTL
ncbi:hypothetical protein ACHAPG_001418 [Botrytis cinerea]